MDILNQYDQIGKEYIKGQADFYPDEDDNAIKSIKKYLPDLADKVLLDFGCGHGRDIKNYEKMGVKEAYGIDPSKYMVEQAEKLVKHPENIKVASVAEIPFDDNKFDIIVSRFAIHYLSDFTRAFQELSRVLKKGGQLTIVADHPIRSYLLQEKKVYGSQEIIQLNLYNNKVPIRFYSHTFQEHLSEDFLKYFDLKVLEEGYLNDEGFAKDHQLPSFLLISAINR